jgi:NADPH:quinone reductase-like Zn-dependent oxidoreductase
VSVTSLELRSEITAAGQLRLSLEEREVAAPGPDEVVVRVEAAPINPADLAELLGPADVATVMSDATADRPVTTAEVPQRLLRLAAGRLGKSLALGLEGAGVVIDAGANAQHLIGKVVSAGAGRMYTQHRRLPASEVSAFPDGVTAEQGASAYVNPLTALGMLSTMRREGHSALVHSAAASNLGQMLNKLCIADGVQVVNVVRSVEQEDILRAIGATHLVNSTNPDFREQLTTAISQTGATLAFDAVGGGPLGGQILAAMEAGLVAKSPPRGPYGSPAHKQLYIYGRLDRSATTTPPSIGMAWGIGGWLLPYHLTRIGPEETQRLRDRVAREITTTFASAYTSEISLAEALDPEVIRRYHRVATGEKYLLRPQSD